MTQFYPGKTYVMKNGHKAKLHFELSEPNYSPYKLVGEFQTRDGIWLHGSWSVDGKTSIPSHELQMPEIRVYGNVYETSGTSSVIYWHPTVDAAIRHVANSDLKYKHRVCKITRGDDVWYEVVDEEKG